jgi:very-short-patch-repair endonuclease
LEYDADRTAYFEERRYRVLRFFNRQVMNNIEEVTRAILEALEPS